MLVGAVLAVAAPPAGAQTSQPTTCAETEALPGGALTPAEPITDLAGGSSCWTDLNQTQYPFGADGNPIDAGTSCGVSISGAGNAPCYLVVDSMAFRAWNRGLAATSCAVDNGCFPSNTSGTTPYGVWLYNGQRWFPDPTFPGQQVCKGDTILWAGKLDYWLVGTIPGKEPSWQALCRFDGANFAWEPLPIPKAALAHVPLNTTGTSPSLQPGAINAGSCFAWNNCWFFGSYGIVLHWDGAALTDATPDPAAPWLRSDYTAAVAGTDSAGNPFALAAAASASGQRFYATGGATAGSPTAAEPEPPSTTTPVPPPQLVGSTGGAFRPTDFTAPTMPLAGDPFQTDLVAVGFDSQGDGWVAGDPRGERPGGQVPTPVPRQGQLAPLTRVSPSGAAVSCQAISSTSFTGYFGGVAASPEWLWSSIASLPGGDAIAGGIYYAAGSSSGEPVLLDASCDAPWKGTLFRGPDPANPSALAPVNADGYVTAVAADGCSNAWAATAGGGYTLGGITEDEVPHFYYYTDGQTPLCPPGDDNESRPLPVPQQNSVFVFAPPVITSPPAQNSNVTHVGQSHHRRRRLPSPIADVARKPLTRMANGTFRLVITFRVLRKVTIGLEALHGRTVVSSSGLHTFRGGHGSLGLILNPKRPWPTKVKFILPPTKAK